MSLEEIIIQEIKNRGPISFRDFMEMCLYYPGLGYYTSPGEKVGKKGDFYTSPCLGPLFGQLVARQIEEMWALMGKRPFTIVEYGAGSGLLCRDILDALSKNEHLYKNISYCIIEKSPSLKLQQKALLSEKVSWHADIAELMEMEGCVLSNELVDNFSVHQVVMKQDLMEVLVDYDGRFGELLKPADESLVDYFKELKVVLPEGFRTEVNLEAVQWIKNITGVLKKGFVLTIDYGFPSGELYQDYRREGNLVCYYHHQPSICPYENIGLQDITSHVNFSALSHWGFKYGLDLTGYTSQAYFLLGLGMSQCIRENPQANNVQGLLNNLLLGLGRRMKVLVQHKNIHSKHLSGLRFSQSLS